MRVAASNPGAAARAAAAMRAPTPVVPKLSTKDFLTALLADSVGDDDNDAQSSRSAADAPTITAPAAGTKRKD